MSTAIPFRRRRDLGDVLNVTFAFIRQNYGKLGRCLLYFVAPVWLLLSIPNALLQIRLFEYNPADPQIADFSDLVAEYMVVMLFVTAGIVLEVLVIYAYLFLYQDHGGADGFTLDDVWAYARARFWKVAGATLLFGAMLFLTMTIVLIPCLGLLAYFAGAAYLVVVFSVAVPLMLREERGIVDAFTRSRELVRGAWWQTFAVLFVTWILMTVLGILFSAPLMVVAFTSALHGVEGGGGPGVRWMVAAFSVLASVGSLLLYPIPLVAAAFQYFSLVEEKERVGLIERIDAMQEPDDGAFWNREKPE